MEKRGIITPRRGAIVSSYSGLDVARGSGDFGVGEIWS